MIASDLSKTGTQVHVHDWLGWFGLLSCVAGCGTLNTARPLAPGEHSVGLTFGGPLVDLGAPIPLPNAVIQGKSGVAEPLNRPLDVEYGVNATGLAFGIVGLHVGASWLVVHEHRAVPALSVATKFYLYDNHLDARADPASRGVWGMNQLEFTLSYRPAGQLLYVGLAEYIDFGDPELTLTPFIGAEFDPKPLGGVGFQVEFRWYAINQPQVISGVSWAGTDTGALGILLGIRYAIPRKET